MKAIVHDTYGSADVLQLSDVERPGIGAGEVLLDVHAAGIDPGVWIFMAGRPWAVRLATGVRRPRNRGLGRAVAGVVIAVGDGVARLRVGDEVYGSCASGSLAEFARAPEKKLALKPAGLSFEQAAAVPISAVTALQAIRDGRVGPGQRVLVIGAGGGVGTYTTQLATRRGATVTAVCSASKADLVRTLGAADVIDYTKQEVDRDGPVYDVVIDTAGSRPVPLLRRATAPGGTIALVGGGHAKGRWLGGFQRQMAAPLLGLFGGRRVVGVTAWEKYEDLDELSPLLESGAIVPVIDRSYPLNETAEAMRHLAEGHPAGRIVVTVRT